MPKLTAKQEAFILMMKRSEEHTRRGFALLLEKDNFYEWFDALKDEGFFRPEGAQGPIRSEKGDSVHIPYWTGLDYLLALAKRAGQLNDLALGQNIMSIIRAVSRFRDPDGKVRDNYNTYRVFAAILGLLPTPSVGLDDLAFIPDWLTSKYNRGAVAHELDRGPLGRFLESALPEDLDKACLILEHFTAVTWIDEPWLGETKKKPVTVVEDHYLKEMIRHRAKTLGAKVGRRAADIFAKRLRDTYDLAQRNLPSWLHRPAIEEHSQNHSWHGPENRFVEGLRDVLLSWLTEDSNTARSFVRDLLRPEEAPILRRIGIYLLNERWDLLQGIVPEIIGPELFDSEHQHELYGLLHDHFAMFGEPEKEKTIAAIKQLTVPERVTEPEYLLKCIQRDWLRAVINQGYQPADSWFQGLISDPQLGKLSEHPDFHSYSETWTGPGPSPYSPQELLLFAKEGRLVEALNAFEEPDSWRGPTITALVDALEEAVAMAPQTFIVLLPTFLQANRAYQYGIINGFKALWSKANEPAQTLEWNQAWERLIEFFDKLITPETFWAEEVPAHETLEPTRDWIPPVIAQFLKAATQNDKTAYPAELLPKAWPLIVTLVKKSEAENEASTSDAMTQAINSSKGKAIEALVIHALRASRVSDKKTKEHARIWATMRPVFDDEVSKCQNANYEFSTLAGCYIRNFEYLDATWVRARVDAIFPINYVNNFVCALDGWTYSVTSRPIYTLLKEQGVLDRALRQDLVGEHTRERIIERIALAYIWEEEELASPRFAYLFESSRIGDLEHASGFFWGLKDQELSEAQISRILQFLDKCIAWSRANPDTSGLLSDLSRLSCYVKSITWIEKTWLVAVAPHVNIHYNSDFFLEELDRLASGDAIAVGSVLKAMLETFVPNYDYENKLVSILRKIVEQGGREDAIALSEPLRGIPEVRDFYNQLVRGGVSARKNPNV